MTPRIRSRGISRSVEIDEIDITHHFIKLQHDAADTKCQTVDAKKNATLRFFEVKTLLGTRKQIRAEPTR
jgi:hypothetical protein